jgi:broad specificity phosphatase PhoE
LVFKGKSLRQIFPVGVIQSRDFLETRRSLQNYLKDLKKCVLTYYKYLFYNNKYKFERKQKLLFDIHLAEYIFHIHKNLINNYYKYLFNKNISLNDNYIFYLKKVIGKKLYVKFIEHFKLFYNYKKNSILNFSPRKETERLSNFLSNFNKIINENIKTSNKIIFYRHAKTPLNSDRFLGIGRDPTILLENINDKKKIRAYKYDIFYSSYLRRSIDTVKLIFEQKKIIMCKELNEIDYGLAEGLNFNELKNKYPKLVKKWILGHDPKFPQGESYQDVLYRLNIFIYKILKYKIKAKKKKVIGVVTHNIFLRCLIGSYFKIDKVNWHKIYIPHLCPLEFIFNKNKISPNIPRNILRIIFSKL